MALQVVTLTPEAATKVKDILTAEGKNGQGLRVFVQPGGCSGYQYGMAIDEQARDGDEVIEMDGVKVFVDQFSVEHLRGAIIDYVDTIEASGFKVLNPNAKSSCGCGHSFQA